MAKPQRLNDLNMGNRRFTPQNPDGFRLYEQVKQKIKELAI